MGPDGRHRSAREAFQHESKGPVRGDDGPEQRGHHAEQGRGHEGPVRGLPQRVTPDRHRRTGRGDVRDGARPREEDGAEGQVLLALEEVPDGGGLREDRLPEPFAVRGVEGRAQTRPPASRGRPRARPRGGLVARGVAGRSPDERARSRRATRGGRAGALPHARGRAPASIWSKLTISMPPLQRDVRARCPQPFPTRPLMVPVRAFSPQLGRGRHRL